MDAEYKPDMVHLRPRANGALIGVGVPWNTDLLIQEYWSNGEPYYALANISEKDISVGFSEWNGMQGRTLLGPRALARRSIDCLEARALLTDYSGTLVAVALNDNSVGGLLRAPKSLPLSASSGGEGIVTVDGLNGIGDRNADLWCLQSKAFYEPCEVISIRIHLPAAIKTLSFGNTPVSASISDGYIINTVDFIDAVNIDVGEVIAPSLSVEREKDNFVIGNKNIQEGKGQEVELNIRLPDATSDTLAVLLGHAAANSGGGFAWARGFMMRMKQ